MSGKKRFNKYKIIDNEVIMFIKRKEKMLETKFDLDDLEKVINLGSWHAILDKTLQTPSYYICHRPTKSKCIKLHRFIMNCPNNKVIDHINHDTLDNRKSNLKICSHFENQQNLRSCKSGITGIYQRKNNKWVANISKNKKRYYKEFYNKEEAINWRQDMIDKLYKEVM